MKILRAINQYGAVYICLAGVFAVAGSSHFDAVEDGQRHLSSVYARDVRAIAAVIDLVAAHFWVALAYLVLGVVAVAFLQIRKRPSWTYWLAALTFCAPCLLYWSACMYYAATLAAP